MVNTLPLHTRRLRMRRVGNYQTPPPPFVILISIDKIIVLQFTHYCESVMNT